MNTTTVPIVIDGPNFINRILDMNIDKDLIAKQLSLNGLREIADIRLEQEGIKAQCEIVEFVCSKKLFGSGSTKFTQDEREALLQGIMKEKGVHIEIVSLPGSSEKGVDTTVSTKIETFAENFEFIVLISHDRDYVPLLKKMREKGTKIVLISLSKNFPKELVNEAYITFDISDDYHFLFNYIYPYFFLQEDFKQEDFRDLISNADDRKHNQLRVDKNGRIYIAHEHVGAENLLRVKFRYETFVAFNGYVGPKAASDAKYIQEEYEEVILGWEKGIEGYIDYPIKGMFK